jgi:hypothetical protein
MVEEAAHPLFDDSVAVLEEVAGSLESGDAERAQNAYLKAREIDARVSGLKEASRRVGRPRASPRRVAGACVTSSSTPKLPTRST